jgi:hypothetical protein
MRMSQQIDKPDCVPVGHSRGIADTPQNINPKKKD